MPDTESNSFLFLFEEVEVPLVGKGRKGKASRPLRIDLILQHDSLVPPPKELVSIPALHALLLNYVFTVGFRT